jgi:hypothetical protein
LEQRSPGGISQDNANLLRQRSDGRVDLESLKEILFGRDYQHSARFRVAGLNGAMTGGKSAHAPQKLAAPAPRRRKIRGQAFIAAACTRMQPDEKQSPGTDTPLESKETSRGWKPRGGKRQDEQQDAEPSHACPRRAKPFTNTVLKGFLRREMPGGIR